MERNDPEEEGCAASGLGGLNEQVRKDEAHTLSPYDWSWPRHGRHLDQARQPHARAAAKHGRGLQDAKLVRGPVGVHRDGLDASVTGDEYELGAMEQGGKV